MGIVTLETESYLIKGKRQERFFPFFELEFNEWVIYENDSPKYYFELHNDVESEFKIINWLVSESKKGNDLRNLVSELGKEFNKKWDIFSSQIGMEVEDSYKTERIDLESLNDKTIEKIKEIS